MAVVCLVIQEIASLCSGAGAPPSLSPAVGVARLLRVVTGLGWGLGLFLAIWIQCRGSVRRSNLHFASDAGRLSACPSAAGSSSSASEAPLRVPHPDPDGPSPRLLPLGEFLPVPDAALTPRRLCRCCSRSAALGAPVPFGAVRRREGWDPGDVHVSVGPRVDLALGVKGWELLARPWVPKVTPGGFSPKPARGTLEVTSSWFLREEGGPGQGSPFSRGPPTARRRASGSCPAFEGRSPPLHLCQKSFRHVCVGLLATP